MKGVCTILLSLVLLSAHGQFMEFGLGGGIMNYTGDLNSYPRIGQSKAAIQGIFRLNLSEIVSMKFALTKGSIQGNDERPMDVLGEERAFSFDHSILELSSVFEYHFLNYKDDKSRVDWSPYLFMGAGFINMSNANHVNGDYSELQFVVPMGAGIKHLIGKRFSGAFEIGARKTFFDYLDGVSDGNQLVKDYQYGNPNDNDWFFYTGISVTYVLFDIPCPFPYIPNGSLFSR